MLRNRLAIAVAAVAAVAAFPALASAKTSIVVSGSTSVAPLSAKLFKKYVSTGQPGKGKVSFVLYQGGSDIGVNDVAVGAADMGEASRDPKDGDPGGLVWKKIARDAICIITNRSNPVANIAKADVTKIFNGTTTNWSGVPGATATGAINTYTRTAASGTQDAFDKIFGVTAYPGTTSRQASNGLIQQAVQNDPKGIGYVSEAFIAGTNAAKVSNVACTLKNAKSNAYPAVRNFWYVFRGQPTRVQAAFVSWVQNSAAAKAIIASGWVPLK